MPQKFVKADLYVQLFVSSRNHFPPCQGLLSFIAEVQYFISNTKKEKSSMHIRVAVIVKIEDLSSTLINIGITIAKKNKQISGYIKRFPTTNLLETQLV